MKVAMVGLGKLGMPCAVAMALKGHDVMGVDKRAGCMTRSAWPFREGGPDGSGSLDAFLATSSIRFGAIDEVAAHAEIIFVAVQTPHRQPFDGTSPLGESRADFDYTQLVQAVKELARVIVRPVVLVVISTVLPGTVRSIVMPHLNRHMHLVYNPYFVEMGATMRDFLQPEFLLLGVHDRPAAKLLREFYSSFIDCPVYETSIENAELLKLAYNTYIGMKLVFANTMMELCHSLPGTDVDAITAGLELATDRILSARYLRGGMGDGGGCHPRDNIAMSWLAGKLNLSTDWFSDIMLSRERQTGWLADLMQQHALPKVILGYAFKAESNLVDGSPALLLNNILAARGVAVTLVDPLVDSAAPDVASLPPSVFLIGACHSQFRDTRFPPGSVVIDPWRMLDASNLGGITYLPVGKGPPAAAPDAPDA